IVEKAAEALTIQPIGVRPNNEPILVERAAPFRRGTNVACQRRLRDRGLLPVEVRDDEVPMKIDRTSILVRIGRQVNLENVFPRGQKRPKLVGEELTGAKRGGVL